ncbi:unnamed protein product [Protopolystoma xenopodis]|uniref:Uncharacterized protein n=1 Tax=Protopolystoma xenopodis TaxID=117903 RepID=A0A448X765_9PLAT|nr:unnamed protein product [Protopolystoma xenopodis]
MKLFILLGTRQNTTSTLTRSTSLTTGVSSNDPSGQQNPGASNLLTNVNRRLESLFGTRGKTPYMKNETVQSSAISAEPSVSGGLPGSLGSVGIACVQLDLEEPLNGKEDLGPTREQLDEGSTSTGIKAQLRATAFGSTETVESHAVGLQMTTVSELTYNRTDYYSVNSLTTTVVIN